MSVDKREGVTTLTSDKSSSIGLTRCLNPPGRWWKTSLRTLILLTSRWRQSGKKVLASTVLYVLLRTKETLKGTRKFAFCCFLIGWPAGLCKSGDVVYIGWPISPSYMSPNAGGGGELRGSQPVSTAVYRSPNIHWRSDSIFNLWCTRCSGTGLRYRMPECRFNLQPERRKSNERG